MDHMLMNINHKLVVKLSGFSQFLPKKYTSVVKNEKKLTERRVALT